MLIFLYLQNVGIFTVSGIIDSFVYHGQRAIKKKMEIGKFGWVNTKPFVSGTRGAAQESSSL